MKSLFILSVLVASVFCQFPRQRCEHTPSPQWMGEMHESNHEVMDPREPVIRQAYIFYDATNKRINITERELFEPGDRTSRITEIYLFNEDSPMRYRVDIASGRCEKEPLRDEFRPFGVPSNSTFHGIDYLGAEIAGLGLLVESFSMINADGHYHGFWANATLAAASGCVPIVETYRNHDAPIPKRNNVHITFQNINSVSTTKPFPPDTFTIPKACSERRA